MIRVPVIDLGAAITKALGSPYSGRSIHEHFYEITQEVVGMTLGLYRVGYNEHNTRLEVRVLSPQGPTNNSMWLPDEPSSKITLSPSRPPKALAREIERRLVQPWLPLWPDIIRTQQKLIIQHDSAQNMVRTLAHEMEGGRVLDWSHREHCMVGHIEHGEHKMYLKARVARHGEVDFEISNVPDDLAKKIVALLRDG